MDDMAGSSFGHLLQVTNFGESHGPAIGCVIDGCPPGLALAASDLQPDLDRRKPGTSRHVTQRREDDVVEILSGVFEGVTTGTPIALLIRNADARSSDYANLLDTFRPGHADYAYWRKYGLRDPRGGGRSSARLTAPMVAAGAVAKKWLCQAHGTLVRRLSAAARRHRRAVQCLGRDGAQSVLRAGRGHRAGARGSDGRPATQLATPAARACA